MTQPTMRTAMRTLHDERARRIREVVVDHIVPGFAQAFPSSVPETVGVLADLAGRDAASGIGCTAGTGRD